MNTVKTLKALANDTRLEIVRMLLGKAMCIHTLARHFQVSEPTICVHIRLLREAGLVSGERRGYFIHYRTNREVIQELITHFTALSNIEQTSCQGCHCQAKGSCHCQTKGNHKHETPSENHD